MTTWNERLLTCMHGIQEGLDFHSCSQCQTVAKEIGMAKTHGDDTFIFTSQKQIDKLRKKNLTAKAA